MDDTRIEPTEYLRREAVKIKNDATARGLTRWWDEWCAAIGSEVLDPSLAEAQAAFERMAGHLSGNSQGTALGHIRAAYATLRGAGYTRNGVVENVSRTKRLPPRKATYPERDLNRMLAEAAPVDRALILLAADAGLYPKDALALKWSDIAEDHSIFVDGQRIPVSGRLNTALHALERHVGPILPYRSCRRARSRLKALCERIGVPYRGVAVLRQHAA